MNFINKKEISAKVLRCLAAGLSDGGGQLALLSNLKRNIQAKKSYFVTKILLTYCEKKLF
jgi:hypothetical protein